MNLKLIIMFNICLLCSGCSATFFKKPPQNAPADDASIKLAEAANSVSDSMLEMAKIEKVILPAHADNSRAIPNVQNLQTRASVDWSGPISELTHQIAQAANYRLRVIGTSPAIPVLVSLNIKDQSLAEILQNIDYQAGKKATIHVYPNAHVVELRYAKAYA